MIKFTVVTITYQAESVLQRTLDSMLRQTYPAVEHLIVDGNSSDGTVRTAQAYAAQSLEQGSRHEVRVQSEPDGGLYDAMNKGIRLATGDYIVFLNAGDAFPTAETLAGVAEMAARQPALPGVLYGHTDIVDDAGHFLRHRRLAPPQRLHWQSFKWGMLVCHQAFYARTDLAKTNPYNLSYRFSADVDWCIRVMRQAERQGDSLTCVPAVVVNYLDGGMTVKNHRASLRERFRVMRTHYGLLTTMAVHLWFVVRSVFSR